MPNHVINEVIIHNAKVEDLRKYLVGEEGHLSFKVLLPMPLNFWAGSCGKAEEEAFPGTRIDEQSKMWGTKWDAYGDRTIEQVGDDVVIVFESAWSHPRGWVCALFNTINKNITASWLSEGGWPSYVERYATEPKESWRGVSWDKEVIEDGSSEHRRLHKLLWGVEEFTDEDDDEDQAA